jgi:hypothetical protein
MLPQKPSCETTNAERLPWQAHLGRARMKEADDIPSDLHRTYQHKNRKKTG